MSLTGAAAAGAGPQPAFGPPTRVERLKRLISLAIFQCLGVRRRMPAYWRNLKSAHFYKVLSEEELRDTRRSETVFVCGSGPSLTEVSDSEWRAIERFDVVSFREFPRQSFVRVDYHVTGEVDDLHEYAQRLRSNPLYAGAVFVVQGGWPAEAGNNLVGLRLLPEEARVFRYARTARGYYAPPSRSFRDGLVHGFNSSISVTNFAYLMGWRHVVLLGVDLSSKAYFWLGPGEARPYEKPGLSSSNPFPSALQTRDMLGEWGRLMRAEGRSLCVFSANSLLAETLPLYDRSDLAVSEAL